MTTATRSEYLPPATLAAKGESAGIFRLDIYLDLGGPEDEHARLCPIPIKLSTLQLAEAGIEHLLDRSERWHDSSLGSGGGQGSDIRAIVEVEFDGDRTAKLLRIVAWHGRLDFGPAVGRIGVFPDFGEFQAALEKAVVARLREYCGLGDFEVYYLGDDEATGGRHQRPATGIYRTDLAAWAADHVKELLEGKRALTSEGVEAEEQGRDEYPDAYTHLLTLVDGGDLAASIGSLKPGQYHKLSTLDGGVYVWRAES